MQPTNAHITHCWIRGPRENQFTFPWCTARRDDSKKISNQGEPVQVATNCLCVQSSNDSCRLLCFKLSKKFASICPPSIYDTEARWRWTLNSPAFFGLLLRVLANTMMSDSEESNECLCATCKKYSYWRCFVAKIWPRYSTKWWASRTIKFCPN
jgi:hypothetical protein